MTKYFLPAILLLVFTSCSIKPQPIDYGSDACHFCSMTIVDRQHAAQIVTEKGKGFNFDATECMLNHLNDIDSSEIALFLTNDYSNPGKLIDATKAFYLVSEGIPSPMGEYLTAFGTKEGIEEALLIHDGDQLNWEQLKLRFEN
ncbi:nitrous oxide reductase accessory protein NosL [Arenibacter certesii]|uniref:Copper chaperone NosL n=1 Tax=Arenibacter certesii TaxID=228955 RepID=A0A918MGE1_9FLAO|nr:nitrous oxide reductase accessory protein NosL [Arenibacter certesii]GGW22274.1 hypothetical protein GCM10007383_02060 [Arenibacter certesii]